MDDEDRKLKEAQENIKMPIKAKNNKGWIVKYKENGERKSQKFQLQDDAWNFFYAKLSEFLRTTIMKIQPIKQKGI